MPTTSKPRETPSMISLKSTRHPFRAVSVMEPAASPRRVPRRRQLLQLLDLLAQVAEQHVGHVHREPAAHHDAQRRKILTVLRERVGRHLPAALAQRRRDVCLLYTSDAADDLL